MNEQLGSATIDKNFRMYIPKKVQKLLELTTKDEVVFEVDDNKIVVWKNIVTRDTIRKISTIKK